jgi:hypothetical protein
MQLGQQEEDFTWIEKWNPKSSDSQNMNVRIETHRRPQHQLKRTKMRFGWKPTVTTQKENETMICIEGKLRYYDKKMK